MKISGMEVKYFMGRVGSGRVVEQTGTLSSTSLKLKKNNK